MRTCLVIPGSPFLLDERVFMSLGVLNVAAVLERADVPVEVLDLSGNPQPEDAVKQQVTIAPATLYGLTATSPQMPMAMRIARTLREILPSARLVLGGPHGTLVHAAAKREATRGMRGRASRALDELLAQFDVLVVGDGEHAVFEALAAHPPRIVDADDPKSPLFLTHDTYEELPWPARHLVDVASYHYTIDGVRALSLLAQRGCPFKCNFCGGRYSPFLRRVRMRSSANIIAEIVHLYTSYHTRGFMLYDDEVTVNPKLGELLDGLADTQARLGVEFRLRGFVKSEMLTEAHAAAMYRAGFRWILVGFESGHPRILENIDKVATREDNTRCMEIATRHGLKVKALMSIGHAGESEESVRATRDWLLEVAPADFDCTVITTYPGTPYFDDAVESEPGVWTYTQPKTKDRLHSTEVNFHETASYYKGRPGDYISHTWTDFLTAEDLVSLRDQMEEEVRRRLGIPYPAGAAATAFEHSMGMPPVLSGR